MPNCSWSIETRSLKATSRKIPTGLKRSLAGPINTVENTGKVLMVAECAVGRAARRVEDILRLERKGTFRRSSGTPPRRSRRSRTFLATNRIRRGSVESLRRLPDTLDNMNHTFQATDETLRKFSQRSPVDGKTPVERIVGTIEMTERTLAQVQRAVRTGQTRGPPTRSAPRP